MDMTRRHRSLSLSLSILTMASMTLASPLQADETCPTLKLRVEAWTRRLADTRPEVRQRAQTALTRLGTIAVSPLLRTLNRTSDANVRRAVVQTLGQIKDPRAAEPLTRVAQGIDTSETLTTRCDAVLALGRLRHSAGAPALTAILETDERPLRSATRQAVLELPGTPAIPLLIRLLGQNTDMRQRLAVRDRLQELSGEVLPADARIWQRWWDDHQDLLD